MKGTSLSSLCATALLLVFLLSPLWAARPSESLLPATTKGYLSVQDVDRLRQQWEKTELGMLAKDPVMKPFVEDLRRQLESKFAKSEVRLNIKLEDLEGVYGGEVALAKTQPGGDSTQHATVLIVDVTGHLKEARALLEKIDKSLLAQKAKRTDERIGEVTLVSYTLPKERGETQRQRAFYFIAENQLVATDHEATARALLSRFTGESKDVLAEVDAFKKTMARCKKAFGDTEVHLRWFVEPFGLVETMRAAAGGRKRRGTDMLKVLRHQGFDAIRGIGGFVSFSVEGKEILHRTFVYAPPVRASGPRFHLAARMLDFPASDQMTPQDWVPQQVTNYLTFHWEMQKAFEYSKTLVDEAAGAPVFDDVMESLKEDPNGPQIDLRQDLVAHLGKRVSFFTDYRLPITPTSERWFLAFEVTNPAIVSRTLDKAMEADPDATKRLVAKHTVWEIKRKKAPAEVEELQIEDPGFGEFGEEDSDQEDEATPLLEHAAFAVVHGYLMVASHLDFMEEVLTKTGRASPWRRPGTTSALIRRLRRWARASTASASSRGPTRRTIQTTSFFARTRCPSRNRCSAPC